MPKDSMTKLLMKVASEEDKDDSEEDKDDSEEAKDDSEEGKDSDDSGDTGDDDDNSGDKGRSDDSEQHTGYEEKEKDDSDSESKDIGDSGNTTSFYIGDYDKGKDIRERTSRARTSGQGHQGFGHPRSKSRPSASAITVDTEAMDTIKILRNKLRNKIDTMYTGYDVDQLPIAEDRATFGSKELEKTTTLQDYSIQKDSILRVVEGLSGAGKRAKP